MAGSPSSSGLSHREKWSFVGGGGLDVVALNLCTVDAQRVLHAWTSPSLPIVPTPTPLIPGWTENKAGDTQMAVGAFEPGAGGEGKGWAADKECFLKQKRKCWLGRRGKEAASSCWWWLFFVCV